MDEDCICPGFSDVNETKIISTRRQIESLKEQIAALKSSCSSFSTPFIILIKLIKIGKNTARIYRQRVVFIRYYEPSHYYYYFRPKKK